MTNEMLTGQEYFYSYLKTDHKLYTFICIEMMINLFYHLKENFTSQDRTYAHLSLFFSSLFKAKRILMFTNFS